MLGDRATMTLAKVKPFAVEQVSAKSRLIYIRKSP